MEQNFGDSAKKSDGKIAKIKAQIESKEEKIKKGEESVTSLRRKAIDLETDIGKEEIIQKEHCKKQELEKKASLLVSGINKDLELLKIDEIPSLKKILKAPKIVNFKEMLQAVNFRCANDESVKFAVKELQEILSWYGKQKGDNEKPDENLSKISDSLDKYVKEEVKLKSVVETIKKLHKMTVSSKAKESSSSFTCYLCKSGINQESVK